MNQVLQLKGHFEHRKNPSKPGATNLPVNSSVSAEHLRALRDQLREIGNYWRHNDLIKGALVSVHYKSVVAKSNRMKILLSSAEVDSNEAIRGAKFEWGANAQGQKILKHVFTYYVPVNVIDKSCQLLSQTIQIIQEHYNGDISAEQIKEINDHGFPHKKILAKTNFTRVVFDGLHVKRFGLDEYTGDLNRQSIVTIYRTNVDTKELLSKIGITIFDDRIIDGTTLQLNPVDARKLKSKAPYLISMGLTDFIQIATEIEGREDENYDPGSIPHPSNEPVIGVIDTHFNSDVYFHEWVEYHNMMPDGIEIGSKDKQHGTAVSYILVDGPRGNPDLDDGCGRFKVRLFGVATHNGFSSFMILRQIRTIVSENTDIKVWNLSLGSSAEINDNYISPEAAELDRIQNDYDVIFVVAGTNKPRDTNKEKMKIGAPADSLNSIVVNAVDNYGRPASYSRVGPVLCFFNKPDLSYYGGDGVTSDEKMTLCIDNNGAYYSSGTSFAAPWVARKLAYMIYILGMNREVAKALLIDAAAGWNRMDDISHTVGYGILPKRIEDIVESPDDEIRFIMTGKTEEYETYTYNLPVPVVNGGYPFVARATLVYFPQCVRNQGVDYTCTEMDIHFGRTYIDKKGKAKIKSINNNQQNDEGLIVLYEQNARNLYRKWDNVKHISEEVKDGLRPKKVYESGTWGLGIKTKERLAATHNSELPFGVVVTLKEINGVNRIDDFIKLCSVKGWLVMPIDVNTKIEVFNKAEEEIIFS